MAKRRVWWSRKLKPVAIARMRTAVSIEKLVAWLEPKLGQQQPGHRESIYAVIRARMRRQGDHAGIERCCALAEVSRAAYRRHWQASAPRAEETALRHEIQRLSLATRSCGNLGFAVNHKRVRRLRGEDNLLCLRKASFRPVTTQSDHRFRVWSNLARKPVPMAVNQLRVADITYIKLSEAFVYPAVILDAFSRRVIGWSLSERLTSDVALDALAMALNTREIIPGGLVHHSDRGVQYACGASIARLEAAGVQPGMSRAGCSWDNVMAESLMRTLKHEEADGQSYRGLADVRSRIGMFLEEVYHGQRLHSALAYRPPSVFETGMAGSLAKAAE